MTPDTTDPRRTGDSFDETFDQLTTYVDPEFEGWSREVFSDPYRASRDLIRFRMREVGLEVSSDGVGNLIGRLEGAASRRGLKLKPLVTGSHTDTVRGGGRFDGVVGVLGALDAVRDLRERGIELDHDLLVIDFLGEEPNEFGVGCVGSRAFAGVLTPDHLGLENSGGHSLGEAMRSFGLDTEQVLRSGWQQESLHAYIELHIEQGPGLERENTEIGVVTAIAGIDRFMARFRGEPDHAGATPMSDRHDALASAAETVLAVERTGCGAPVHGVATTGKIETWPGSINIVPAEARINAELRSIDADWLSGAKRDISEQIARIAADRGVTQMIEWLTSQDVAPTTPAIRDHIVAVCQQLGFSWKAVPSGAGHDAAHVARLGPMGMIFVPSVDGHSHRPEEFTEREDIRRGIRVLTEVLIRLDGAAGALR